MRPVTVLRLMKAKLCLLVSLSAACGYVLAAGSFSFAMALPVLGVFVLAAGSAAINQVQDRDLDARMKRTRIRPLPAGEISLGAALTVGLASMIAGLTVLAFAGSPMAVALGLLAVVWYNGLYHYLKRRSPFAAVPGAVVGAIVPAIGWAAAGGDLGSAKLWAAMGFLFLWQVPHFWLILLSYPEDYQRARLPNLASRLGRDRLERLTFVWILATAVSALTFPLFGLTQFLPAYLALLAGAIWLSARALSLLSKRDNTLGIPRLTTSINSFALLALLILMLDQGL